MIFHFLYETTQLGDGESSENKQEIEIGKHTHEKLISTQ